jgi:hypothetical protein
LHKRAEATPFYFARRARSYCIDIDFIIALVVVSNKIMAVIKLVLAVALWSKSERTRRGARIKKMSGIRVLNFALWNRNRRGPRIKRESGIRVLIVALWNRDPRGALIKRMSGIRVLIVALWNRNERSQRGIRIKRISRIKVLIIAL